MFLPLVLEKSWIIIDIMFIESETHKSDLAGKRVFSVDIVFAFMTTLLVRNFTIL